MPYDYEDREEYEPWHKDSMTFSVNIENLQEEAFVSAVAQDLSGRISSKMIKKIEAHVEETLVKSLTTRVDEVVENLVSNGMQSQMQPSDQFSNPKGEPITLTEFIAGKAEGYLQETVDRDGKPSKSVPYGSNVTPRLNFLMSGVIDKAFEKEVGKGVTQIKSEIKVQMEAAAAEWLAQFQAKTVASIEGAKSLAIRAR